MGSISKTLVFTTLIYLITLAYGLNFVFSGIALGIFSADFLLILLIMLLPLLFYALYALRNRYELLHDHASALEKLIFATAVISALFTAFFIIPITYA